MKDDKDYIGLKYDNGKPRLGELVCDFKKPLLELCKVWEYGASKYGKSNWKHLDHGVERYTNAMLRHLVQEDDNLYDDETGMFHAAHIAFNALARLYFISRKQKGYSDKSINEVYGHKDDEIEVYDLENNEDYQRLMRDFFDSNNNN